MRKVVALTSFICLFALCTVLQQQNGSNVSLRSQVSIAASSSPAASVAVGVTTQQMSNRTEEKESSGKLCPGADECESDAEIGRKWGYGLDYSRVVCCKRHPTTKAGVIKVFAALEMLGIPAFLESGSVLGVVRHNNRLIPWETDADIGFVVRTKKHDHSSNNPLTFGNFDTVIRRMVHTSMGGWTLNRLNEDDKVCVQYQLKWPGQWGQGAHIDLFGYLQVGEGGSAVKRIGGCFAHEYSAWPFIMPSKPCRFYDAIVPCPRDTTEYLAAMYGPNATTGADSKDATFRAISRRLCKAIGNPQYYIAANSCQCNAECHRRQNCCADAQGMCLGLGFPQYYIAANACQCNYLCRERNNCCADARTQ
jgi:hypothetical protein